MASCKIFLGPRVVIVSKVRTDWGWHIDSLPVFQLSATVGPQEVGQAVIGSLQAYREGVPHPEDRTEENDPVLRELGFRSWSEQRSLGIRRTIETAGETATILPWIPDSRNGGYSPDWTRSVNCRVSAEAIGDVLYRLWNKERGHAS